jgi:hypothetical protein
MPARRLTGMALAVAALAATGVAAAKEFAPGDLRACNADRCTQISDKRALKALSSFYYGVDEPVRVEAPRMGTPYFELRFRNGYVTGIVATAKRDRFLSYGVNLNQFSRGRWYRVPPVAARELRRLTSSLKPRRLTLAAVLKSR